MKKEPKVEPIIKQESKQDKLIEVFQKHFPQALQETEQGFLVDKEQLQRALEPKNCEVTDEALELRWVGKKEAYHSGYSLTDKIIQPLKEQSKDFENTGNVLIKGDNLDALKLLQKNYFERIKMIYIDPPYNTQNDNFIYRDNFTKTQEEVLDELGYDKEQKEYIKNIAGAKTHSGWLSFIYPRLLLARELLRDDGVIFISIDDNEQANLKLLCDEVFGEMNFIGEFIWNKKLGRQNDAKFVSKNHEYIICFCKTIDHFILNLLPRTEIKNDEFKNLDNDFRGNWIHRPLHAKSGTEASIYEIEFPNGVKCLITRMGDRSSCLTYSLDFAICLKKQIAAYHKDNSCFCLPNFLFQINSPIKFISPKTSSQSSFRFACSLSSMLIKITPSSRNSSLAKSSLG